MSVTIHGLKLAINVSEATEELREEIHQAIYESEDYDDVEVDWDGDSISAYTTRSVRLDADDLAQMLRNNLNWSNDVEEPGLCSMTKAAYIEDGVLYEEYNWPEDQGVAIDNGNKMISEQRDTIAMLTDQLNDAKERLEAVAATYTHMRLVAEVIRKNPKDNEDHADRALVVLNTWADRLDTARYGDNGARLALLEDYAQQERNFGESLAKWAVEDAKYPVKSVATDNTEEPTKPDGYSNECDCAACEAYRAERDRSTA